MFTSGFSFFKHISEYYQSSTKLVKKTQQILK